MKTTIAPSPPLAALQSVTLTNGVFCFEFSNGHSIQVPVQPDLQAQTACAAAGIGPPVEGAVAGALYLDLKSLRLYVHSGSSWAMVSQASGMPPKGSPLVQTCTFAGTVHPADIGAEAEAITAQPGTLYYNQFTDTMFCRNSTGQWIPL